jgi:SAM-dependent methyltransferase
MNFVEVSKRQRQAKLQPALDTLLGGGIVLDIGVWCAIPEPHASENWLEKQYPGKGTLICIGVEDMRAFKRMYPEVIPVQADGRALPFKNESLDLAVANAVLEHISAEDQESFVNEICRVVRKEAILAVPDRICPIEIHSRVPILHWFPAWRKFLRVLGKDYWADPENLSTIFSHRSLRALLDRSRLRQGMWQIRRQFYLFIPISLVATFTPDYTDRSPLSSNKD